MKLPVWFRIIWWLAITALTAWLFYSRLPAISQGQSAPVDVFVFLVLVALLLVPIFQEVSFFGLKFKQAIDDLQKNIVTQLALFKADIQTSISNTSNVNINVPSAPTDDQLPGIEAQIRTALSEVLLEQGIFPGRLPATGSPQIDDDTMFLFQTRYTVEKKLKRIAATFAQFSEKRSPPPVGLLTSVLVRHELLPLQLVVPIREIYSVCSPAIHGDKVTQAQVNFVRDVAPQVIDALSEIERRTTGSTVP
jgi:hypothetical protein